MAVSSLPASISTSFQGAAQAFQSAVKGLGVLLIIAILVIYVVLGILYESFVHPITILSGLPARYPQAPRALPPELARRWFATRFFHPRGKSDS